MSIRYGQFCPIAKAAEVLGERWTLLIIRELLLGTCRFSDFQRALSQISPTLLTKRLSQLQDSGLVVRKPVSGQRRTEYFLTPAGRDLGPVVVGLGEWGMKWARGRMSDDELDVQLLMYDLTRRLDATQLPSGRTVIHFVFTDMTEFRNWWIVLEATGERELCTENPHKPVDAVIRSDVRTLTEIYSGDAKIGAAISSQRLLLSGSDLLAKTISSWLRPALLAHIRPNDAGAGAETGRITTATKRTTRPQSTPATTPAANEKPRRGRR